MIRTALLCALLTACAASAMAAPAATKLAWADTTELQQRIASGKLSIHTLTKASISRIQRIDQSGPQLRSVLEINPDALAIAHSLDSDHKTPRGPLYGIPVLLKDNIDTGDHMQTTAGSLAMEGEPASMDAGLVARLRSAGMLILGKANLSEWANMRSNHATSGWTGRGGQTRNPYALDRNPCGSSAGSAAAVAAGLVPVAVGTETDGSIICPASMNGIVGLKPTVGLVSRSGIIPISHTQDTAGPMARNVTDAARLLTAMAGGDPRDPATAEANQHATDYTRFLDPNGLRGKRIGVVRAFAGVEPNADRVLEQAIAVLRAQGAVIVDQVEIPHLSELSDPEGTVLAYDFKHDLNAYLATRHGLPVHDLAGLIAYNQQHAAQEMPWFGQELFIRSQGKGPLTEQAYLDALAKAHNLAGPQGIDAALQAHHLDALLAPSWGPAFMTDPVLGDHIVSGDPNIGGVSQPAAVAGYPSITVPAGNAYGLPVGIVFFGAKWSEPTLITVAYGFEQHGPHFERPRFLDTVKGKPMVDDTD